MIPAEKIERIEARLRQLHAGATHHVAFFNAGSELLRSELPVLSERERLTQLRATGLWQLFMELYHRLVDEPEALPGTTRIMTVRWPSELHEALRRLACERSTSLNKLVTRICAEALGLETDSQQEEQACQSSNYTSNGKTHRASSDVRPSAV